MVTEQAAAIRTRSSRRARQRSFPDGVARVIMAARAWDLDSLARLGLAAPRAGWAATFTDAAERGFLPRAETHLSEQAVGVSAA